MNAVQTLDTLWKDYGSPKKARFYVGGALFQSYRDEVDSCMRLVVYNPVGLSDKEILRRRQEFPELAYRGFPVIFDPSLEPYDVEIEVR